MPLAKLAPVLPLLGGPPALHLPDGFLSLPVAAACWLVVAVLVAVATRRLGDDLGGRQVPLIGILAAFVFAAQMINFPVAGGTSGHLLGGALVAILVGPWAGILVMTAVVALQALLFQDGGLVVMGANILNMGLLTALLGHGLYRGAAGWRRTARLAAAGTAAWLSVMAAALATSLELVLSGTVALRVVVPAMLGVHALIGVGEALITVGALSLVAGARPDALDAAAVRERGGRGWAVGGLLAALAVVLLAPLAVADPDGLERVAEDLGFGGRAAEAPFQVMAGYAVPSLGDTALSTVLAGAVGALVAAGLVMAVGHRLLRSARAD
jgi:cobalt/nickel transport system permease protein